MSLARALTIGFAGQRPLALQRAGVPLSRLEGDLRAVLGGFGGRGWSVRLVTGLAMGADQGAIGAVGRLKREGQDWGVRGVLPCPVAVFIALALGEYAVEFGVPETPEAKADLVAHWRGVIDRLDQLDILPGVWRAGEGAQLPAWALALLGAVFGGCEAPPEGMTLDHSPVAEAILGQSDVLVAVWDGSPAQGKGGTADMIAMARARRMPVLVVDPRTGAPDIPVAEVLRGLGG